MVNRGTKSSTYVESHIVHNNNLYVKEGGRIAIDINIYNLIISWAVMKLDLKEYSD